MSTSATVNGYVPRVYLRHNLPGATHVDLQDRKYIGERGGHEVVSLLKKRPAVTKITLNQNLLGNEGTSVVLAYLLRNVDAVHVTNLSLNCCGLGLETLRLLAGFLKVSESLKELSLQNNAFQVNTADPSEVSLVVNFALALSRSRSLVKLDLGRNPLSSDAFVIPFLSNLSLPTLAHLNLSAMHLSPRSHRALLDYLGSSRAIGLRILETHGNRLTRPFGDGILSLVTGYREQMMHPAPSWRLLVVGVHGCLMNSRSLPGEEETVENDNPNGSQVSLASHSSEGGWTTPPIPGSEDGQQEGSSVAAAPPPPRLWVEVEKDISSCLARNRVAGEMIGSMACRLLAAARTLFSPQTHSQTPDDGASTPPLRSLPFELKVLVLKETEPNLSANQCGRIARYVADGLDHAESSRLGFTRKVMCDVFEPECTEDVDAFLEVMGRSK